MRRRFSNNTTKFDVNNYLSIEALEDGLFVLFTNELEYAIDGQDWKVLKAEEMSPKINKGHVISFRANLLPIDEYNGIGRFSANNEFHLFGNCNSLLFGDNAVETKDLTEFVGAFARLFSSCNSLKSVSSDFLPATKLGRYCYYEMFYRCTNLEKAPELPATTLAASYCYERMFYDCKALVEAPELPATTLETHCYDGMFEGCTSLVEAPELPATTLASYCYRSMFSHCYKLEKAPVLPALTLKIQCYYFMFASCENINYIKMLATDISASQCLEYWVSNVASTGTFVKNGSAMWEVTGVSGIPEGWTIEYE